MAQSKIYTIISHEYIKRIKSKGFILGTLLGPFALLLIIAVPAAITILSMEDTGKQIAVVDKTESISDEIIKTDPAKYFKSSESQSVLKEKVLKNELDGYLYLPEDFLERGKGSVYTKSGGGIGFMNALRSDLSRIVRHKRLIESGASEDVIKMVESGINIETQKITEE
ncbi:MAG: ABC transporter permease, partial [Bacteroidota bacterium]